MAETWPNTRARRWLLNAADYVGRTAAAPFRRGTKAHSPDSIRRILVIEPWNIGDVILATPLLRALRDRYPKALISLLAKPHAVVLLNGSGLVDDFIACDLPWTASRNKYPFSIRTLTTMNAVVRALRDRHFDVTLDARMDIRSNVLAALSNARQRIGYSIGGGGWLLTDSLPAGRSATHKIDDWLDLLALFPDDAQQGRDRPTPMLSVSDTELKAARGRLLQQSPPSTPIIGYHPGGSHPGKRWPLPLFGRLIRDLDVSHGGMSVVFLGPDDEAPSGLPPGAIVRRLPLRELMAEIACCNVLVCNDSGPMHIADALGVPVVAIFEIGNPQWYGPSGPQAIVVCGELAGLGLSAAPLDRPPAHPVSVERVAAAVVASLEAKPSQSAFVTPAVR